MKKIIIFIFLSLLIFKVEAKENLKFFLKKAIDNNLELNAERKNLETAFQEKNISRSEFLPSISLSGNQSSSQSSNKTSQSGSNLSDSSLDTETKTISVDQKIFQGFKGYNSLKKSELEVMLTREKRMDVFKKCLTFLDTRVELDQKGFKEDIFEH